MLAAVHIQAGRPGMPDRPWRAVVLILSVVAAAILLALFAVRDRRDEVAAGGALAQALCRNCHLSPGQGEKDGPSGIPGFYAVAKRPGQTFEKVVAWLDTTPPMMPNHHLTRDEKFRLAAYIMSLAEEEE